MTDTQTDGTNGQLQRPTGPIGARCGVDVQSIDAFRQLDPVVFERIKQRSFSAAEQAYCESTGDPAQHFAARWAVKEAVRKVISEPLAFSEIPVDRSDDRPTLTITDSLGAALTDAVGTDRWTVDISMSHDRAADAAMAQVMVVGDSNG